MILCLMNVNVGQGERRGSLEFIRNESAFVDFKKKFDDDLSDAMPDIMANGTGDAAPGSAYV